ncbi:MAG: glycoside hydrolase family 15, partial [Actinotalea sp.]|nr:glycoside hydrolase family 15 [Actinotalea sp.]
MPVTRRRRRLLVGSSALLTVGLLTTGASSPVEPSYALIPLYSDGVALDADGVPRLVPVGSEVVDDPDQRARQDAWLARGSVPGPERYRPMAEQALRDLDALVLDNGASLAAGSPYWRYVWPRDASFAAAALARTGHPDDAHAVLAYLARMQDLSTVDGVLQARYLPTGTGAVPDARPPQLDGSGWVLWGVAQWYAAAGPGRGAQLEELRPLVTSAVSAIRDHVDPTTGLSPAFPDYWEVSERRPTLGTMAALLTGARAAAPVLAALGEPPAGDL